MNNNLINKSNPVFSTTNKKLYDLNYNEITQINEFPSIPLPDDCETFEEFTNNLKLWKNAVIKFSEKISLPIPIGHILPRPTPPEIIPKSDLEDLTIFRKLKRKFDPETSLPSPSNQIAIEKIILTGQTIEENNYLPYPGLNEKPVPIRAHLSKNLPWCSQLIPKRPQPNFYSTFEEYENSIIKWADLVINNITLPPSPKQIGKIINLPKESKIIFADPPLPEEIHNSPLPFCSIESNQRNTKHIIKKLSKAYTKFLNNNTSSSKTFKSSLLKSKTFSPPNSGNLTASNLIQSYIEFGLPYSSLLDTPTQIRRQELMTLDIGYLADPELLESNTNLSIKLDNNEIVNILKTNIVSFLNLDFSPRQFQNLLYEKFNDQTIGEILIKILTIENLVKYSIISTSLRFLIRCAIIGQYFLGFPETKDQVLQLDLSLLERFVELISITTPNSIQLSILPDEEISAAISASPKSDQQIEMLSNDFRQAQLLLGLQQIVFPSQDRFFPALTYIRQLLHTCYSKISEIITSDVYFPLIKEGYLSNQELVHMFYYRIFRTLIQIQYTKIIRVLAIHDLLPFFFDSIHSKNEIIKNHSLSLWQLLLHTDSSLVLRMQILNSTPTSIVKRLKDNSLIFTENIYQMFILFRKNESEFDYRPFPLSHYKSILEILIQDLSNPMIIKTLELLLTLASDQQSIYTNNEFELKDFINKFSINNMSILKSGNHIKCLKILFKSNLLDSHTVLIPDIWNYIFTELLSKKTSIENRLELWKTFRNSVLHQKGFITFLLSNPDLSKKLGEIFSSYDESVSACMILILPPLAKIPVSGNISSDNEIKNNFKELILKISDPTVLISGRLLAAYMSNNNNNNSLMARVHSSLITFLNYVIDANENNPLYLFRNSKHVQESLGIVFKEMMKNKI